MGQYNASSAVLNCYDGVRYVRSVYSSPRPTTHRFKIGSEFPVYIIRVLFNGGSRHCRYALDRYTDYTQWASRWNLVEYVFLRCRFLPILASLTFGIRRFPNSSFYDHHPADAFQEVFRSLFSTTALLFRPALLVCVIREYIGSLLIKCLVRNPCHFSKYPLQATPSFLCILEAMQDRFAYIGEGRVDGNPVVLYALARLSNP